METLKYESKPVPSVAEDFWKGSVSKKRKPAFERQDGTFQKMVVIVQYFGSNYVPPKKK